MVVHLLVLGQVVSALRVDVVAQHVLPVDRASHWGVRVALSVGVESWFAQIGHERGIREPSGSAIKCV